MEIEASNAQEISRKQSNVKVGGNSIESEDFSTLH